MGREDSAFEVEKGDHYRQPDGTDEVVYAVEDEVVLTIREYHRREDFERAVDDAEYLGIHEGVATLPDVESIGDG